MSAIDRLPAVSLPELDDAAALQQRRDRKYLLGPRELAALLAALGSGTRALEIDGRRRFGYRSRYFDTADRRLYLATAHARPRRTKVRTRTYIDSGETRLEVKVRDGRGRTVKHRFDGRPEAEACLDATSRAAVAEVDLRLSSADLLPVLLTRFTRSTLLLAHGGRATIDLGLELERPDGRSWTLPDIAVVETKSPGSPTDLDRLLWRGHVRPVRFSKFGTGLAALDPSLPANRWHRALVRLARDRRSPATHAPSVDHLTASHLQYGLQPHATS